jgi:hypothetical protein
MSKVTTQAWSVRYQPIITKEQVEAITKKATIWQKLRLLFRPSHYSFDDKSIIRYKEMDGITFVMKRGTKL